MSILRIALPVVLALGLAAAHADPADNVSLALKISKAATKQAVTASQVFGSRDTSKFDRVYLGAAIDGIADAFPNATAETRAFILRAIMTAHAVAVAASGSCQGDLDWENNTSRTASLECDLFGDDMFSVAYARALRLAREHGSKPVEKG